jgi:phage baseplate assembly protein gpV
VSRVVAALQAIARHELERRTFCELAVVTSVFDAKNDGDDGQSVSLTLKDTGVPITRVPVATGLTGVGALPRVGDVVLVLFPRGDLASAIVAGQVYSDARRPPDFERDEARLVWPADADDPDKDAVSVSVKGGGAARGLTIELGGDLDAKVAVTDGAIELTSGGVKVRIAHSSGSDGTVEVAAGGTRLLLQQDGDLTAESQGTLTLKAPQIVIEGDTSVKVNGQTVEIN